MFSPFLTTFSHSSKHDVVLSGGAPPKKKIERNETFFMCVSLSLQIIRILEKECGFRVLNSYLLILF